MDGRDFRVRAFVHIPNEGAARGLEGHVRGPMGDAVDINSGMANQELKTLSLDNHWDVRFDLCFPPDKQDVAEGLFNHTKNVPSVPSPYPEEIAFVSMERCGHRIGVSCNITERHEIV